MKNKHLEEQIAECAVKYRENYYRLAYSYVKNADEALDKISANQNFYINEEVKFVISFDKYEVAPGYMGVQEFVVPTEAITDILVSNQYIK